MGTDYVPRSMNKNFASVYYADLNDVSQRMNVTHQIWFFYSSDRNLKNT